MSLSCKPGERISVRLNLNGIQREALAEARTTLCDFLRDTLGATGTHVGCEHGVCGACTILLDGHAVRSCLTLALQADGRRVDTVEGMAVDGTLTELQQAFQRRFALQCGYCTPGILASCTEFLQQNGSASEESVRQMLAGHLCRCTGYTPIVQAVIDVAAARGLMKSGDD